MKTKSIGLAIVLTLLFGPFGLFYASLIGGIIMCFTPLVLTVLLFLGALADNNLLFSSSALLLILFAFSYWVICLIWSATAVSSHNKKVIDNLRTAELLEKINNNKANNISAENQYPTQDKPSNINQLTLQQWKKNNPQSSINDYYSIYGIPKTSFDSNNKVQYNLNQDKESNNILFYIVCALTILLILFLILIYDKETKSFDFDKFSTITGLNDNQKEIEEQIENVYFGLINGAYSARSLSGTTPENLPFYNSDLSTLMVMGFAPLTMISGNFSLEPKNIKIKKVYDNKADVLYDLVITYDGKERTNQINMTLKKIGGNWKLDGQKFLTFDNDKLLQELKKK